MVLSELMSEGCLHLPPRTQLGGEPGSSLSVANRGRLGPGGGPVSVPDNTRSLPQARQLGPQEFKVCDLCSFLLHLGYRNLPDHGIALASVVFAPGRWLGEALLPIIDSSSSLLLTGPGPSAQRLTPNDVPAYVAMVVPVPEDTADTAGTRGIPRGRTGATVAG